ncbi:hypothetical protein Enr13x_39570 [Stieleria neptunia]|uniref:Uncharacterized protein n=1 Tax=Stieleria neptunia TaxID=2527979 RepID=A0A518HTD2_9BACT|nr:hypothetical protein Enr13x_39570 [Stieleria neptunia]
MPHAASTVTIVEAHESSMEMPTEAFGMRAFLRWWPVRGLAFVGSVTLTVHVIARSLGLENWRRWLFAVAGPTIAMVAWHGVSTKMNLSDRHWFSTWDLIEIGVVFNAVCYAVLNLLLIVPTWFLSAGAELNEAPGKRSDGGS